MTRWAMAALVVWMVPTGRAAQSFSFHPAVSYPAQNGSLATVSADFNGDGKPDLAVGNAASSSISIFLGNGDGSFSAGPVVTLGSACAVSAVAAGDFTADGLPDLLAVCGFQTSMWVALNSGGGQFAAPQATQLPEFAYQ